MGSGRETGNQFGVAIGQNLHPNRRVVTEFVTSHLGVDQQGGVTHVYTVSRSATTVKPKVNG